MRDEEDVIQYYRQFLVFCQPLVDTCKITDDERDSAFWYGFHPDDREALSPRLIAKHPDQSIDQPYSLEDVYKAARAVFTPSTFLPIQLQDHWNQFPTRLARPERLTERWIGQYGRDPRAPNQEGRRRDREPFFDFNPRDTYVRPERDTMHATNHLPRAPSPPRNPAPAETRTVRFVEPTREEEDRELDELMDKMHGLSVRERSYAVLYARCAHRYPDVARDLPKPEIVQSYPFQTSAPSTFPPRQPWAAPQNRSAPLPPNISPEDAFFRARPRPIGCSFCSQTDHRIRECPIARDYVRTGRAMVINDRIHLPNSQSISGDNSGSNLQTRIDAWLSSATAAPTNTTSASTFTRDSPPHTTLSFVTVGPSTYGQAVQQAHIIEVTGTNGENEDENAQDDSLDFFGVYATEKKKRDAKASKLPELTQAKKPNTPTTASTSTPTAASRTTPQYKYQSNAEDQQLSAELYKWLLDGKLSLVTPAHILAASPGIRKELVERLRTRRVDAACLEETFNDTSPTTVLELAAPRTAEYSLPLREIDVLVNGAISEAGVLDQGSQIVVIRWDLVQEAGATVNKDHRLDMEGANGLVSKTLGCAENLTMQVGDVSFTIHAHVVDRAPFRLLLGRPFHHLLLCRLEDHPDGRVEVSVRDPTDPARSVSIPSRARKAQVGCITTFTLTTQPAPLSIDGASRYQDSAHELLFLANT